MSFDSSTIGFRSLAALGCVALILFAASPFLAGYFLVRRLATPSPSSTFVLPATSTSPGMGMLGARCGGVARLPCRPGLMCTTDASPNLDEGVCAEATSTVLVVPTTFAAHVVDPSGSACTMSAPSCAPGSVCVPTGGSGSICSTVDAETRLPRVMRVSFDGLSPSTDGVYQAVPGTRVAVSVQAANASDVVVRLGDAGVVSLKKSTGGMYTGSFMVTLGMRAQVAVVASSKDGATALWYRVASVQ